MDRATGKSFEGINILNGRRTAVFVRIDQAEKQIEKEAKAQKVAATRP